MGKLIEDPTLLEIGKKYSKNGAQTALGELPLPCLRASTGSLLADKAIAWGIAHGHSVIPKSKTPSRIADNLAGDFKLEAADVEKIDGIDKKLRFNDASANFGWNFFKDLDGKK